METETPKYNHKQYMMIGIFILTFIIVWVSITMFSGAMLRNLDKSNQIKKSFFAEYPKLQRRFPWMSLEYYDVVNKYAKRYQISPWLICGVIHAESEGKFSAVGPVVRVWVNKRYIKTRAIGLMQIIPEYHYSRDHLDLFEPELNIQIGSRLLGYYMRKYKRNVVKTLKAYNSGPHSKYYNWPYIKKIQRMMKPS